MLRALAYAAWLIPQLFIFGWVASFVGAPFAYLGPGYVLFLGIPVGTAAGVMAAAVYTLLVNKLLRGGSRIAKQLRLSGLR